MKLEKNELFILPDFDCNGDASYKLTNDKNEENLVLICPKIAQKVIPVIFLPGVMGTNLINSDKKRVWHADSFMGSDALTWVVKGPKERKMLLNPETTDVDYAGKIIHNDFEGNAFPSRYERGWGSAIHLSYGKPLHVLQSILNDSQILMDNLVSGHSELTTRQRLINENLGAEKGEEPLTEDEVRKSYNFLFPLHVYGYNWLKSNVESAHNLDIYINKVLSTYSERLAVNKVILVTHSMGGLVARHYSENFNGKGKVLGIVHGVMPDLGSPAAYRRMKTGEKDPLIGRIIGTNADNLMPVLAQSPGPLQLLPGISYGSSWLKIKGSMDLVNKPISNPYQEIYLNKDDWWRLCEKDLLLDDVNREWEIYKNRIKIDVQSFIEGLSGKYHSNTYAFYGASKKHPSDEHLIWKELPPKRPVFGIPEMNLPYYRRVQGKTYELTSSASPGDGTVPVKAGRIKFSGLRSLLATDVEHEGAYAVKNEKDVNDLSFAMKFTLRSIIKIANEVSV